MQAKASSAVPARLRRYAGWTSAVLAATLIWLGNLFFPSIPSAALDPSWQLVLNHAAHADFVFGRDLVYTYGPWGWLTTQYYFAETFPARLAWEFLFKALAAVLIVATAATLSWPRRAALVAAALVLPALFQDTLPMLLIAGLVLWSAHTRAHRTWLALAGAFLGFLALQKFTYLLMIAGALACVGIHYAQDRRWRDNACLFASVAGTFLLGWLAAGQPLAALPAYLRHAAWISSAYNDAMFLDERAVVFRFGVAAAGLFLALVWDSPRRRNLPLALALTGLGFILWKQGFVRADGHTAGFFFPLIFAGIVAPWINPTANWRRIALSWTLSLTALAGVVIANPEIPGAAHRAIRHHLASKAHALRTLGNLYRYVDGAVAALRAEHDLPAVRAAVGPATIDQFGHEQAVTLLNRFDYRPRPVFQGFAAYSGPLAALNETAWLSPRAPAFTLARLQTIDGRYPPLDDARLLPRLITDHTFVLSEKGFLLLRRNPRTAALTREPLASGQLDYSFDEQPVPAHASAIWAGIDVRYSWLGSLRRLLYKPPAVSLILRDSTGVERRFRLIVPAARAGFLLSPLLRDTPDLERLVSTNQARSVRSFRLEIPSGAAKYFLAHARFELSTMAVLPFAEASPP